MSWHEPMLRGMKIPLKDTNKLSEEIEVKALKAASAEAKTPIQTGCPTCLEKDFSEACPLGWTQTNHGMCEAPFEYDGLCRRRQSFQGGSAMGKIEVELSCGVCWPCKDSTGCLRNWALPCPDGYSLKDIPINEYANASGNVCLADLGYDGPCEPEVSFEDARAKQLFAERCKTSWACNSHCETRVNSRCPQEWTHIGGDLCVAPATYKVPGCKSVRSFRGWTAEMKTNFSEACRVSWPCESDEDKDKLQSHDGPVREATCELDLSRYSCPRSWSRRADGFCEPPPDPSNSCEVAKKFDGLSAEEKILWASDCLVDWPCIGEVTEIVETLRQGQEVGPIDEDGRIVNS